MEELFSQEKKDYILNKYKKVLEKINEKALDLKVDIKEIYKFEKIKFSNFDHNDFIDIFIFAGNYNNEKYLVEIAIDHCVGMKCQKCYNEKQEETKNEKKYKKIINDILIKLNMERLSDEKLKISKKFNKLIKRFKKTNLKPRLIDSLKSLYVENFFQDILLLEYAFLINDGKRIIFSKIRKNTKCTIIIGIDFFGNYFLEDCVSKDFLRNKNTINLERKIETELRKINGIFKPAIKNIVKIVKKIKKEKYFQDGPSSGWEGFRETPSLKEIYQKKEIK